MQTEFCDIYNLQVCVQLLLLSSFAPAEPADLVRQSDGLSQRAQHARSL